MKIDRKLIYDKFGGKCAYCGCELNGKFQVDHIIPQRNFETHIKNNWRIPEFLSHLTISQLNHIDNLFPSCASCNKYKDTHCLETFRYELGEMRKRLNNLSTHYKISKRFGLIKEIEKPIVFYFEEQSKNCNSFKEVKSEIEKL